MRPTEYVLQRFKKVRQRGDGRGYSALCSSHADVERSLSVTEAADGKVLIYCFGGCKTDSVLEAVGLRYSDLFPRDGA